jgi:hypothetical protein
VDYQNRSLIIIIIIVKVVGVFQNSKIIGRAGLSLFSPMFLQPHCINCFEITMHRWCMICAELAA